MTAINMQAFYRFLMNHPEIDRDTIVFTSDSVLVDARMKKHAPVYISIPQDDFTSSINEKSVIVSCYREMHTATGIHPIDLALQNPDVYLQDKLIHRKFKIANFSAIYGAALGLAATKYAHAWQGSARRMLFLEERGYEMDEAAFELSRCFGYSIDQYEWLMGYLDDLRNRR